MEQELDIAERVAQAQKNVQKADDLIRDYLPFIRAEASHGLGHFCTQQEDGFSIAMLAFHEAVLGYQVEKGAFFPYAARRIQSRLIDWQRKENRQGVTLSLDTPATEEDDRTIAEVLPEQSDPIAEAELRDATRQEIAELAAVLTRFGVSFADAADNAPQQERTLEACGQAVRWAGENKELLDELLRTGKLPMGKLSKGSGVPRKTLERHRKYLVVMLLIQTNGYEIMRGHLRRVLRKRRQP